MVRNFVDEGHFIVQLVRGEYVVVNNQSLRLSKNADNTAVCPKLFQSKLCP